jgi:hypothetical protein
MLCRRLALLFPLRHEISRPIFTTLSVLWVPTEGGLKGNEKQAKEQRRSPSVMTRTYILQQENL